MCTVTHTTTNTNNYYCYTYIPKVVIITGLHQLQCVGYFGRKRGVYNTPGRILGLDISNEIAYYVERNPPR